MELPPGIELLTTRIVPRSAREAFIAGPLRDEWAKKYPMLFDELNIQTAMNVRGKYFYEWDAARYLYDETGYLSLVEKYRLRYGGDDKKARRFNVLRQIVPPLLLDFLLNSKALGFKSAAPDLFVFKEDHSDWYFCEVKGVTDSLKRTQVDFFQAIAQQSGKPVKLITYRFA